MSIPNALFVAILTAMSCHQAMAATLDKGYQSNHQMVVLSRKQNQKKPIGQTKNTPNQRLATPIQETNLRSNTSQTAKPTKQNDIQVPVPTVVSIEPMQVIDDVLSAKSQAKALAEDKSQDAPKDNTSRASQDGRLSAVAIKDKEATKKEESAKLEIAKEKAAVKEKETIKKDTAKKETIKETAKSDTATAQETKQAVPNQITPTPALDTKPVTTPAVIATNPMITQAVVQTTTQTTAQTTTEAMGDGCSAVVLPKHLSFSDLEVCQHSEGVPLVVVDGNKKYGFVNHVGQLLVEPRFDEAWSFQNQVALVKQNDQWGYIKTDGSYLVRPQFDDAWGFGEGLAKFKKDDKFGFINQAGKVAIVAKYDEAGNWFENGVVAVMKDNKWGLIDKTGRLLTPMHYDYIGKTQGQRIAVAGKVGDDTLYGFINPKGELVIALRYSYASDFNDGVAVVVDKDGRDLTIDLQGRQTPQSNKNNTSSR